MKTLVLATPEQEAGFSLIFPRRPFLHISGAQELKLWLPQAQLVFDFLLHQQPERISLYNTAGVGKELLVFCEANKVELEALKAAHGPANYHLCGINSLADMVQKGALQVSVLQEEDKAIVAKALNYWGTLYELV